jgi:hypothetical protein
MIVNNIGNGLNLKELVNSGEVERRFLPRSPKCWIRSDRRKKLVASSEPAPVAFDTTA